MRIIFGMLEERPSSKTAREYANNHSKTTKRKGKKN